jgi:hypothetical protein
VHCASTDNLEFKANLEHGRLQLDPSRSDNGVARLTRRSPGRTVRS